MNNSTYLLDVTDIVVVLFLILHLSCHAFFSCLGVRRDVD